MLNLFNFIQFAYARHSSSKLDSALAQSQISGSHCEPSPSILRGQMLKRVQHDLRMIGTLVDFVFLLLTRHKMRASSALVSFVGSEILKQVWYFARLFAPLAVAESTAVDFVFLLLTRHKMQASSALVSFVGSEILKQVCFFARLFVPLAFRRKYSRSEKSKQVWYFARLFVPLPA